MIAARLMAFVAFLAALLFALAAIVLFRSADPVVAFAPLGVTALLGWCAAECWKGPGVTHVDRGVRAVRSRGQAPAHVEI